MLPLHTTFLARVSNLLGWVVNAPGGLDVPFELGVPPAAAASAFLRADPGFTQDEPSRHLLLARRGSP